MAYDHSKIEKKWQARWKEGDIYRTSEDSDKEKKYVLDMFPYPSGEGLHVGHPKGYIATDIYSRMMRMKGYSVLHPMGWDAFGLPAENFALKHKTHPSKAVEANIATFKQQLAHIGFDYDWSREINTTDPAYYHWTQWIFLKLFEHKLAYQSNEPINWCPSCMTGLANEDLDGNVCERCGTPVEEKRLPQWVLKITDYADRMLTDLDTLDWPEHIKEAQRNWIGRSEGAEINFELKFTFDEKANENRGPNGEKAALTVFTTRPDTIFGATYMVLAPEHPWVTLATDPEHHVLSNKHEVKAYIARAAQKSEIERTTESKEKTGVLLKGVVAINPATKEEIPIYVADYVLGSYGTGAIMAVPAHDERDYAFAKKFDLPIKQVIVPAFYQTTEPGMYRKDEPTLEKNGIIALIRHWENKDKYIGLKWKTVDWGTLLTGGVDEGFTPEQTVLKEIREETGYTHAKIVESLGVVDGIFYHVPKQTNQHVHGHMFVVDLLDGEQESVPDEEKAKHDIVWLTTNELKTFLTADTHQYTIDTFVNGYTPYTGSGTLVNSEQFEGKWNTDVVTGITEKFGRKKIQYKIRDWVFSRQRYWGEPIPIIHCPVDGAVPVPYEDLPVVLPEVESYEPTGTGESPLAAIHDWVNVACPVCGGPAKRETNTMPQWAGSSWYYLRFMDPTNEHELVSEKKEKYWAPVDVYVGGDHAVRHLIYGRFWHKFLYDIGIVSTQEPFARLEFLGFILAPDGRKMSKRLGNVINPDDVVEEYGADAFRIYEMFMGPFENTTASSTASIKGTARFIERVWGTASKVQEEPVEALDSILHETIKKIGEDIEAFKFNTAVSQLMVLQNAIEKEGMIGKEQWHIYLRLLAPLAPHLSEELWEQSGGVGSIHASEWPVFDEAYLIGQSQEIVIQVNGKRRASLHMPLEATQEEVVAAAKNELAVERALTRKGILRTVFVPGKVLNFVIE